MTTGATTDDEVSLAREARAGSHSAFAALVARHETRLFRFLRLRVGDAALAEDLTQDTFVRCWTKLRRYDPARPFGSWLYRVAVNLTASHMRRRRRTTVEPLEGIACGEDPAAVAERRDASTNLWAIVARVLSPDLRSALWLFYAEDLSAAEVGEILGRSEGAVRIALFRAREHLAPYLARAELSLEAR